MDLIQCCLKRNKKHSECCFKAAWALNLWILLFVEACVFVSHHARHLSRWVVACTVPLEESLVWVSWGCSVLAALWKSGSLREGFETSAMIFLASLPVSLWFGPSQSCWVLMLFSCLFTPQGISSQCLWEWTDYNFCVCLGLNFKSYSKH